MIYVKRIIVLIRGPETNMRICRYESRYVVGNIAGGWVATPLISGVVCFVALFFLQNVFNQQVFREVHYVLSESELTELGKLGMDTADLKSLKGREFQSARAFMRAIDEVGYKGPVPGRTLREYAQINRIKIDSERFLSLDRDWLSPEQVSAIERLEGREFSHRWQLARALAAQSPQWSKKDDKTINKIYNKELDRKLEYVSRAFAGFADRR